MKEKLAAFECFAWNVSGKPRYDPDCFHYTEKLRIEKDGGSAMVDILGLNSALFAGYDGDDDKKLALGQFQVDAALKEAEKGADLTIALFHHPFPCLHNCEKVSRNSLIRNADLILTGHVHEEGNVQQRDAAGNAVLIGAGASFAAREWRNSFGVLDIDLDTGRGRVRFYEYVADHNTYVPNNRVNPRSKRGDGAFAFVVESLRENDRPDEPELKTGSAGAEKTVGETKDGKPSDPLFESQIDKYLEKAAAFHESLPLAGFRTKLLVPIRIEDIYVPLRAMVHLSAIAGECYGGSEEAEEKMDRGVCEDVPLKDAFLLARQLGRKGLAILGDPGSGKTTHLKRILLYCVNQDPEKLGLPKGMVPVFLPLRELKSVKAGLDSFIQEQLSDANLGTPPGFGKKLLEDRGNLLLLFDGLDEISDFKHRQKVSRWIENALQYHHKSCFFVATSRFAGYKDNVRLNEHFLEMHVRPLSEEHAEQFIRNWYSIVESGVMTDRRQAGITAEKKTNALIRRLRAPEFRARRVFEMTRNPLLLANLCIVHRARGDLPRTRAKLYEECVDVLLERWRQGGGVPTKITADQGRRVLQPAARWMHQQENRARAKADELAPVIEPTLRKIDWRHGDARQFLETVRDESGILVGWGDGTYGFMHLGFQEYLAAREIRNLAFRNKLVLRQLAKRFGEAWYQEVILLLLALEEPSLFAPFMREVVKRDAFFQNSEMVDLCLDEAAEKSFEPFSELVEKGPGIGNDEDLWRRQLAALRVLERWEPSAVAPLMDIIRNHPFPEISRRAKDADAEARQKTIRLGPSQYELVWVPGGEFMMGSDESEYERPIHRISLEGFYMGRYPVTNREYGRFLEATGHGEPRYWDDRSLNQPKQPVVGVSWHDANKFAQWANLKLPSEAQWEYACRAGTTTCYYTGDTEKDLDRAGWYDKNSGKRLHPVGEKEPNAWGLYDMHGNVWEWTRSLWGETWNHPEFPYPYDPSDGREDMSRGAQRVVRGGSLDDIALDCRSAFRFGAPPCRSRPRHRLPACLPPIGKKRREQEIAGRKRGAEGRLPWMEIGGKSEAPPSARGMIARLEVRSRRGFESSAGPIGGNRESKAAASSRGDVGWKP